MNDPEPQATLHDPDDTESGLSGTASSRPVRLLVFSGETISSHPLLPGSHLVIGRAAECQIQVDVPALSRKHAEIRGGPPLTVEDLGSANGTRLRGEKLTAGNRARLRVGDAIEMGPLTIVVQRDKANVDARPRRLWTHGYFEGRLEEECARAEAAGVQFTVLRLKLQGTSSPQLVQETLAALLAPTDVVAAYGPGEYEVLISGSSPQPLMQKLSAALDQRDAHVLIGAAIYGKDGRDPDALLFEANRRVERERATSERMAYGQVSVKGVIIDDPQMRALHALVKKVAQGDISVLLLGETGVGKEVFAEALHAASPRAGKPFQKFNCASFTETLLESELFGHEKGAFTGAVKAKPGLIESANGGSVLLDEVGEMPLSTQVKLLRVLEAREVMRVGDVRARPIDVRFIAATHRDLEAQVAKGNFRQDLFFRLNGISLVIPPLRERIAELESLARHFIARAARQFGKSPEPTLTPEALALLQNYAWPGNLRELRNMLERAVLLANDRFLGPDDLPLDKLSATPLTRPAGEVHPMVAPDVEGERAKVVAALELHGGNQTLAARALGISRRTMLNRLDAYAIPRPRKGK
ncbi:MAG: sigma 54-interacting transcriptional regulator [Archangium sp.]|nr:sigma 54-interacting transcriptional regulator [Archangium sp.]MDP3152169.1 sigma 54-interacting transcriptional regulator [Archangium sp.]MDP3574949.1 sigma 54-interacting transcriptional regulator [Archangium sp.]